MRTQKKSLPYSQIQATLENIHIWACFSQDTFPYSRDDIAHLRDAGHPLALSLAALSEATGAAVSAVGAAVTQHRVSISAAATEAVPTVIHPHLTVKCQVLTVSNSPHRYTPHLTVKCQVRISCQTHS